LDAELKRLKDNFEKQTAEYTRKLYLIEHSIYGVDIQPIAVQIAKLRFFIALIVSQKVNPNQANLGMLALPNLETRIVAANGLQPLFDHGQEVIESEHLQALRKQLVEQQARYFRANTRDKKKTAQNKIEVLQQQIQQECFLLGYGDGTSGRLLSFRPFDQNSSSQFFDPNIMFGFDKFNLVIGNPPYVRHESIKPLKDQFKKNYACFTGTADLYVYFYEQSFNLLEPHGSFAFITSNKWYRANYGAKLRDWMKINTRIHQVIDFGDEAVFTALAYPTIVVASKRDKPQAPQADEQIQVLNWDQSTNPEVIDFPRIFEKHHFTVQQDSLQGSGWQLEPQGKRDLLAKIRAAGQPLGEYVKGQLYYGIKTGLNEAFVIDGATRAQLIATDEKSAELIKPFLRGRDVKRWQVVPQDLWLIKIESSENKIHTWSNDEDEKPLSPELAEKIFKESYPAIHTHLNQFRQGLINRYDQGRFFWELRACAYWAEFEKPKILFPDIATSPQFTFDREGYYLANTAYVLPTPERSMVAILNSQVSAWFYAQISPQIQNGYFRFIAQYVEQIPIAKTTEQQKTILETLVDHIMQSTERAGLEYLMNGLVYELFFTEDAHAAGVHLFDTCTQIGLDDIDALAQHPTVLAQLATIHSLPDVQLIERSIGA
jgi:adenine-specific DNA-methyltransferase